MGPNIAVATVDEVLAAAQSVSTLDWDTVRERVIPMLPRVRPSPPGCPEELRMMAPPGLPIGFGIDVGPAFLAISAAMLALWRITSADLLATALANLERYAASVSLAEICHQTIDGVPVRLLQARSGSGSAFIMLPGQLERMFGSSPQLLVTPMRNLLISMPLDVDRMLAYEVFQTFAAEDPNSLPPIAFLLRQGEVSPAPIVPIFGGESLPPMRRMGAH